VLIDSQTNGTNKYQLSRITAEVDAKIAAAVAAEAGAREAADDALQDDIDTRATSAELAAETAAREQADADLREDLSESVGDLKSAINDVYYTIDERRIRLAFENGAYSIGENSELAENNSQWNLLNSRRSKPIKVPAYSQFIVTNSTFRGNIFISVDGVTYESKNWLEREQRLYMPTVDSYVAFSFTPKNGESVPTLEQVHDGFYIQPPFKTNDYIELMTSESEVSIKPQTIPLGQCIIGSMSGGVPALYSFNRIVFLSMFQFDTDVTVRIASGYRVGFHIFVDGEFSSDSGWIQGTYAIPAGTTFKFIIAKVSESSVVDYWSYWWFDFIKAVTFEATEQPHAVQNISLNKPFMFSSRPKFMLHRGLQSEAPENSAPAFRNAGQNGAWAIETDVYETSDGHFVCIHDATVDRTTDGTGNVRDKTLAQIEALNIDTGEHIDQYPNLKIPTFAEYLSICKTYGCVAFIEIKGVTNLQGLYDMVKDYGMLYNSVFIVWESLLNAIRGIDTESIVPCMLNGYAGDTTYETILNTAKQYKNVMLGLQVGTNLTDAIISEAHENNITVGVWTVYTESDAIRYFERGIDIATTEGITDYS